MTPSLLTANRRILVIDDNRDIHDDFRKILGEPDAAETALLKVEAKLFGTTPAASFEIDSAFQGEEGLKRVQQAMRDGRPYAMAFVDVRMPPGWDGIETTRKLWEAYPDLQVVICTAYSDYSWEEMSAAIGSTERLLILKKPFDTVEVLQLACALTEKWRLLQQSKVKLADLEQMVRARTQELENSRAAALNMMEDAVEARARTEAVNEDLKRQIAERERAEAQVREQADLLNMAHDAVLVRDLEDHILFLNAGAERLYGWTKAEAIGQDAKKLFDRELGILLPAKEQVQARGQWSGELPQVNKKGKDVLVSSRWTLVRDGAGAAKGVLIINTDITEQKKLESQFLRTQRLESIGALASGIAHDMNNILAPILMSVPLIRLGLERGQAEKLLATIEASAQRGAELVKQLLTFGRGSEGLRAIVQPRHLLKEVVKMAGETFPKSITVKHTTPSGSWPIMADSTQLHQVLLNLCVNARDAMPSGGTLSMTLENARLDEHFASMHAEAKAGPYVIIKVQDTGMGIPTEILEKIFDPFFTTKQPGKGTGLGLSTVQNIVKAHEGFIIVRSKVGQGTTFEVYIPASPGQAEQSTETKTALVHGGQGELVLVVDDEAAIRDISRKTLERNNYRVITAADGVEAVALYAQHRDEVKVIVMDLVMPFLDGVAMARALKRMDPAVRIIASSGLASEQGRAERLTALREMGINIFLAKPYKAQNLLQALQNSLQEENEVSVK